MWNSSSTSGANPAAGGGSGAGSYGNMAHTPTPFAAHARSNSLANSPSAHRRAGAMVPIQHAPPSSQTAFSRPFANAPFPGTVAAPRSALPPASASAQLKSIQSLPLLTARTPASLTKLPFPTTTTVHWLRVQKPTSRLPQQTNTESAQQEAAAAATTLTGASQDTNASWTSALHDILSNTSKPGGPSRDTDKPQSCPSDAFEALVQVPLLYTAAARPTAAHVPLDKVAEPSIYAAVTEFWLFAAVNDDPELASTKVSNSVPDATAPKSALPQSGAQASGADMKTSKTAAQQQSASSSHDTPFHPAIAHLLPLDAAKALARLLEITTLESGCYLLSSASPSPTSSKGKQASLTSQQHEAHWRFLASLTTRAIDAFAEPARLDKPPQRHLDTSAFAPSHASPRGRLRLGKAVVSLPPSADIADTSPHGSTRTAQSTKLGGPATASDQHCVATELHLSLCSTALLLRASSRRLAALPLASTPRGQVGAHASLAETRPQLCLAPLAHSAELVRVVSADSIASDHLSQLRLLFASLHAGSGPGLLPLDQDLFARGLAVCAIPSALIDAQPPAEEARRGSSHMVHPHMQNIDDDMGLNSPNAASLLDLPHQQPAHDECRFLWPVAWCLVAADRRSGAWRSSRAGELASNDLHTIRSEPVTPLKELVSFTLKVLNDANETVAAQSAPPFTPGEPDDASLSRHRGERHSSTRPGITPASMSFADFDLAIPSAASATPSHSLPTAPRTVSEASPEKRDVGTEATSNASGREQQFADDLNWMESLTQAASQNPGAPASMPVSSDPAVRAGQAAAGAFSASNASPAHQAEVGNKDANLGPEGSRWAFPVGMEAVVEGPVAADAQQDSSAAAAQALLQPQGRLHSSGSTPFQGNAATPLSFTQAGAKRKEGDIFGNLGLLTEDDFSFFDESAFGLDSPGLEASGLRHSANAVTGNDANAGQPASEQTGAGAVDASTAIATQAPSMPSAAGGIGDVEMEDLEATNLDALFGAIPNIQDVIGESEHTQSHATEAASQHPASSTASASSLRATGSSHPFAPVTVSFTPRDVSAATPFGDPASLPGFTPSSLTESSPAFGHANHKTPRTPYSPVEEYRDGATIVGAYAGNSHGGESAQSLHGRYGALPPQDPAGLTVSGGTKLDAGGDEDQLRLADASTAAAAAANAAMSTDANSKKRPAIVPNAFLPLNQPQARKPLQRLTMGARANLGRKYDVFGKFASRPKSTASLNAMPPVANAISPDQNLNEETKGDATSFPARFALRASRSPSKALGPRGQALLQLRRDRNSKMSPGQTATTGRRHSGQRAIGVPATPRSSDDIAVAASASDSGSSSSEDEDEASDDARSDSDSTLMMLSPDEQEALKRGSKRVVAAHVCSGAGAPSAAPSVGLLPAKATSSTQAWRSHAEMAPSTTLTIKRSMLSRTARWLIENPQFRAMYSRAADANGEGGEVATREKLEVLAALASALRLSSETEIAVPTLRSLVQPDPRAIEDTRDEGEPAEVLEPTHVAVGCEGSVVSALPSALSVWDKSKLSAVSGPKHVVAKVLLTHASPAWHDEIVAWLERLRVAFEAHGLGTHTGGARSILAVADGSEPLALSSYLERLWRDGEAWLDTLRSIASRVELDLLQGRHVVLYTLQPPGSACAAGGFRGLLQLETDLRAMLSEQVGVLAEQMIVRPISPALMTESGSLGFGQRGDAMRRLAVSVYDQLPRLVRRQPAKVLHGREPGAISAAIQFPAFSLATGQGKTGFEMSWPREPATAVDGEVVLHVAYRICSVAEETVVVASAVDERGGSSHVDVLVGADGSVEASVEQVWRFAVAQASRARLAWRLVISSAGVVRESEQHAWQARVAAYFAATRAEQRVMASVALLCVRPDDAGAVLVDAGERVRPGMEVGQVDKAVSVLMDAADCSQVMHFAEALPLDWTASGAAEGEEKALSVHSAIIVHRPRREPGERAAVAEGHVLAVDLLASWPEGQGEDKATMERLVRSLHAIRLLSCERSQLPQPYAAQPWCTAAVNAVADHIRHAHLVD